MKSVWAAMCMSLLVACTNLLSTTEPLPAVRIDPVAIRQHIEVLASDRFEGRKPGTVGEELTVGYLVDTFKRYALSPGNPNGSYLQEVRLTGVTSTTSASIAAGGARIEWQSKRDFAGGSLQPRETISVHGSQLVFVGHGVVAPEYGWDDYKQVDVRGKTVVILMDDPHLKDGSKTYYATSEHKRHVAAQRGAVARITVHEIERAGG